MNQRLIMVLERFKKYCSRTVRWYEGAVFLGFGVVSAPSQDVSNLLRRRSLAKTPKIPAPRGYIIFLTALAVVGMALLTTGCKTLFPSKNSALESKWKSYAEVQSDFGKIIPDRTGTNDLKSLGFDPSATPNVKVLTYVDVIQIFMPNPGIRRKDLPEGVRECIDGREQSCAYQIDLQIDNSHRYGNLILDMLGFRRKTHETGWNFKGLILIKDGIVVYKLSSGEPQISRNETVRQPLGPLQDVSGSILGVIHIPK